MAAALSLTPIPVDFGNLYAENIGWGIAYTSIEVTLASGMMFVGGNHMCHEGSGCGSWSEGERYTMVGLVGAYVAVKIVSAVHASNAAAEFNRAHLVMPVIAPTTGGLVVGVGAAF